MENSIKNNPTVSTIRQLGSQACDTLKRMFLSGECDHLTVTDIQNWISISNTKRFYTADRAAEYMRLCRTRFYDYKRAGLIPEPIRVEESTKLLYTKEMLDNSIKFISSMSEREVKRRIKHAKLKMKNLKNK